VTTLRTNRGQARPRHRQTTAWSSEPTVTAWSSEPTVATRLLADRATLPADEPGEQHHLAGQLQSCASHLAPGWLGAPLDDGRVNARQLAMQSAWPAFVRIGEAHALGDARFPVVVPLLGAGHLAFDADARDPRVAAALRSVLLRLLAAAPPGLIEVRAVDAAGSADTLAPYRGVVRTESDHGGLRAVLAEAEKWVEAEWVDANEWATAGNSSAAERTMVIVIASLPELTEVADLDRIAALADAGAAARLHLVAAGWPPPPLTAETTQPPLRHCTQVTLRNPHVWVGDPPGASFAGNGVGPGRLNAPVFLDPDPSPQLIAQVCEGMITRPAAALPRQPTQNGWPAYLAAAQRLDTVRRAAAAVADLEAETAPIDRAQTVGARRRARPGPYPIDVRQDEADAPVRSSPNAIVYLASTALGILVQLALVLVVSAAPLLALIALPVGFLVPAGSFALGWLALGRVFGLPRHRRTAKFGAALSAVALLPLIALIGWLALGASGGGGG
jgi:hypothetical protein